MAAPCETHLDNSRLPDAAVPALVPRNAHARMKEMASTRAPARTHPRPGPADALHKSIRPKCRRSHHPNLQEPPAQDWLRNPGRQPSPKPHPASSPRDARSDDALRATPRDPEQTGDAASRRLCLSASPPRWPPKTAWDSVATTTPRHPPGGTAAAANPPPAESAEASPALPANHQVHEP